MSMHRYRAFSLTELLVVIGIIVLLVGLLLVALGGVRKRARATQTETTMRAFAQAMEAFQLEHQRYPGDIPETAMDAQPDLITTNESTVLAMMGGSRAIDDDIDVNGTASYTAWDEYGSCGETNIQCIDFTSSGWQLKVDRNRIGEGPLVDGRPYSPYYTVSSTEVRRVRGQDLGAADLGDGGPEELPELVDAWGQPIIVLRRLRPVGELVGSPTNSQFSLAGTDGYLKSTALGEMGMNQERSVFDTDPDPEQAMARLIRHRAFGKTEFPQSGTARGSVFLISAGADGVFFAHEDGPGNPETPVTEISNGNDPDVPDASLDDYDDIIISAGG